MPSLEFVKETCWIYEAALTPQKWEAWLWYFDRPTFHLTTSAKQKLKIRSSHFATSCPTPSPLGRREQKTSHEILLRLSCCKIRATTHSWRHCWLITIYAFNVGLRLGVCFFLQESSHTQLTVSPVLGPCSKPHGCLPSHITCLPKA